MWKDSEVPSFALLTTEANALWRGLGHDTMPAILPGDGGAWRTWLRADWKRAAELLAPYPSSQMAQT